MHRAQEHALRQDGGQLRPSPFPAPSGDLDLEALRLSRCGLQACECIPDGTLASMGPMRLWLFQAVQKTKTCVAWTRSWQGAAVHASHAHCTAAPFKSCRAQPWATGRSVHRTSSANPLIASVYEKTQASEGGTPSSVRHASRVTGQFAPSRRWERAFCMVGARHRTLLRDPLPDPFPSSSQRAESLLARHLRMAQVPPQRICMTGSGVASADGTPLAKGTLRAE